MTQSIRPTRSQHQLLTFIAAFITEHGYGPSYREIMRAFDYKSVSTVATHVEGLIARGWLRKQGRSARSLEVVAPTAPEPDDAHHRAWLVKKLHTFAQSKRVSRDALEELARSFGQLRLSEAKQVAEEYLQKYE